MECLQKQPLLNTSVNNVSMNATIQAIDTFIQQKKKSYIVAINADSNTFHADFNARSGLGTDLVTGETVDFGGGMELPPYSAAYWKTEVI